MTYTPTKLHKILQSHCVALINKKENTIATGLLLRFMNVHLVLTVHHLFYNTSPDDILVNLGTSGQRYVMKKMDFWENAALDLCFFRLDDFEVTTFSALSVPFEIKSCIIQTGLTPNLRAAICGFPSSLVSFDEMTKTFAARTFLNTTSFIIPERWPSDITNKNPKDHFLLAHGTKKGALVLDEEGNPTNPEQPYGLSGAGVWLIDSTTENAEKPIYSLFGIQTSFFPQHGLLCGSFIDPMIKQIEKTYGTAP
jgi:hypothetical protein